MRSRLKAKRDDRSGVAVSRLDIAGRMRLAWTALNSLPRRQPSKISPARSMLGQFSSIKSQTTAKFIDISATPGSGLAEGSLLGYALDPVSPALTSELNYYISQIEVPVVQVLCFSTQMQPLGWICQQIANGGGHFCVIA